MFIKRGFIGTNKMSVILMILRLCITVIVKSSIVLHLMFFEDFELAGIKLSLL